MIGLRALDSRLRKRVDHHPQRACSGSRQKLLLDGPAVHQQASLVARLHHRLRQSDARAARLIELREAREEEVRFDAASRKLARRPPEEVERRSSKTVPDNRPASTTIQTCWLRSVVNSRVTTLARRALAGQEIFRISSPER